MFNLVYKKDRRTFFLIVAGGPMRNEYIKAAEYLGINENVIFAGQIKYPEVLNYFRSGDVFVFASKTETQGLVIAEAKACGLPVVALDAEGVAESVVSGEDGFLVSEDTGDFLKKVFLLLDDTNLRQKMSLAAKANSSRDYSSINIAKKVEKVYNSLKLK